MNDVSEQSRSMRNAILDSNNEMRFNHGRRWESPANTLGDKVGEMQKLSTTLEVSYEDIVSGKIEVVFQKAKELSTKMHEQITGSLIESISSTTEKLGAVINRDDRSMHEVMYEAIEKMELTLDDHGELSMPTFLVHPDQYDKIIEDSKLAGPNFETKLEKLKEQKKKEAIDKERDRFSRFERPSV